MSSINVKEIRDKLDMSQEELAEHIGVSIRTVQYWESGENIPKTKHAILRNLLISKEEKDTSCDCDGDLSINDGDLSINMVPLLPVYAQGGSLNDFVVSVKNRDFEKIVSPICGAEYAITIAGDSMAPEYPSGSRILIKRIDEDFYIEWGKAFVLVTSNGTLIKVLLPSDDGNPEKVKCVSINENHPPFEINIRENRDYGVYRVLMCLYKK